MKKIYSELLPTILALMGVTLLFACSGKPEGSASDSSAATPAAGRSGSAPAITVSTVPARAQDFPIVLQAIGTTAPIASVDVRPQMSSVITDVHVREGQFVNAGELLFTLDSRPDEANVAKMRAQLAKDEAALADAKRQYTRSRELLAQNFISQGAVDTSQAQLDAQMATVNADLAALDAARVALSYARVTAPSSGRVGTVNVYRGTSVQANVTSLATITQLDPIDISFSLPQRYLGDALAALKTNNAPVTARLPEAKGVLTGRLSFVDNAVDPATGTVKVKARYNNHEARLWPGAFVNVELTASTLKKAVVIPMAAIIQTTKGPIVYVAEKGKASQRSVVVLASQGEDAAVTGIQAGERVVLDGKQNLRPDSAVAERQTEEAAKPAAGASGPKAKRIAVDGGDPTSGRERQASP